MNVSSRPNSGSNAENTTSWTGRDEQAGTVDVSAHETGQENPRSTELPVREPDDDDSFGTRVVSLVQQKSASKPTKSTEFDLDPQGENGTTPLLNPITASFSYPLKAGGITLHHYTKSRPRFRGRRLPSSRRIVPSQSIGPQIVQASAQERKPIGGCPHL